MKYSYSLISSFYPVLGWYHFLGIYILQEGKSWSSPVSQWPPVKILKWQNTSRWFMLSELPTMRKNYLMDLIQNLKKSSPCPNSKVIPVVCVFSIGVHESWCLFTSSVVFGNTNWGIVSMVRFHKQGKVLFCSWILLYCVRDEETLDRVNVHTCEGQKITFRSQLPPSTVGPSVQTRSSGLWNKCLYNWAILLGQTCRFNSCNN